MTPLDALLTADEGKRYAPYMDCCGKSWRDCRCCPKGHLSCGIGRNLDAVPFTAEEVQLMFETDKARAIAACRQSFYWFDGLNDARKTAVVSLTFNMGLAGFRQNNPKTIAALATGQWERAAAELLDGPYKFSVGHVDGETRPCRAHRIAEIIKTGELASNT